MRLIVYQSFRKRKQTNGLRGWSCDCLVNWPTCDRQLRLKPACRNADAYVRILVGHACDRCGAKMNWTRSSLSLFGWLIRKEVLLAGLYERKILLWLKIYDHLRHATAKWTGWSMHAIACYSISLCTLLWRWSLRPDQFVARVVRPAYKLHRALPHEY